MYDCMYAPHVSRPAVGNFRVSLGEHLMATFPKDAVIKLELK